MQDKEEEITFHLPKLEMDVKINDLLDRLEAIGFPKMKMDRFSPGSSLSEMIQKCMIRVDEKGTVASAATAGFVSKCAGPRMVRADRAFFFIIMRGDTQLFIGAVKDETALFNKENEKEHLLNLEISRANCAKVEQLDAKLVHNDENLKEMVTYVPKDVRKAEPKISEFVTTSGTHFRVISYLDIFNVWFDNNRTMHIFTDNRKIYFAVDELVFDENNCNIMVYREGDGIKTLLRDYGQTEVPYGTKITKSNDDIKLTDFDPSKERDE